ncbi:hypothetical protein BKA57DRAFT_462673 [Linnemannia elongata]|uniref:Phytanoyl-CoA hydroxylase-interacting protein-like C-terminal domain-containing protein n=1 Tax=Linnemannia elongata AG-77 TaxID=1314771 RepID=A0A197JAA5_9FUNG|nr:hypothetical protein BKA57DRAFT_462673 [Linnemannia elongata]KAK5799118.1 hypothetical protein F5H01DRAFT_372912 [Linnemannia elongata]OAQ22013.1 hypothetical protein K457DRAFT_1838263 [Linnemannia elongata AG-77]OAQ31539.1 hypothetical protein K457DRAFT_143625 [Linnemannia elongata AG-77]
MGAIQSFLAADLLPHPPHQHRSYEPVEAYCRMLETLIQKRYQEALTYCTPATSQPCRRIYRNWHPDDQQRQEKQLEHIQSRFLLSYPAEKYNLVRDDDHSPVVNPFFNLSGLFFCATGSPMESELDPTGAGAGGPVATSPYGKTRFQVEFGQLQRVLFPNFKLYFADHYKVVGDWYIQLIVVPSWNVKLEEQCVQQGMIELDIQNNPFFYRADDGQYWVSNSPKLWMELFIGCDTIPTTDLGEVVESRLHEKVRKTRNRLSEQEERERHARVIENVARDLVKLAEGLRQGLGPMDRELVDLTYGLSMSRTQLGVMQAGPQPVGPAEHEPKEISREE